MQDFNEAMFKTKVDNIFVKLYTAIMEQDLLPIKHFLTDELYSKYSEYVDALISKNERQMYDELNVKDTKILTKEEDGNTILIVVEIVSRYLDYVIDANDGNFIRGNTNSRVEKRNILTFIKKKDTKEQKIARKCPNCGANISVNTSGVCSYCGSIYNLEDYDFILSDLVTK